MSQIGGKWHVGLKYPELVSILKMKIMKTLNYEKTQEIFTEFALSSEEMINVRGGDSDPAILPTPPSIKI